LKKLVVPLTYPEFEALRAIAVADRRRPQDQAAVIISTHLAQHAAVPEPTQEPAPLTPAR
jgi:hypothetical protein